MYHTEPPYVGTVVLSIVYALRNNSLDYCDVQTSVGHADAGYPR